MSDELTIECEDGQRATLDPLDELPEGPGAQRWLTFGLGVNREILHEMIDSMLAHKRIRINGRVTGKIHKISIGKAGDVDVDLREVEVSS